MSGLELRASGAEDGRARRLSRQGGTLGLGSRLVTARRVRLFSTLTVLGISVAFILLMLALASELGELADNPAALGRRYQLTAALPASAAPSVAALAGVAAAAPRYEVQALDAYALGETIDLIGYPGDHTVFEAPALASGQRLRGPHEAEVGQGLAEVLGLQVGSTLAVQLPSGHEARFRVSGIVTSLQHDGRVAYVAAQGLLAAEPAAGEQIAVRLLPSANRTAVTAGLQALGATPAKTAAAVGTGQALVDALTSILRVVAIVNGLVCLYALIQALVLPPANAASRSAFCVPAERTRAPSGCCWPVPRRRSSCRLRSRASPSSASRSARPSHGWPPATRRLPSAPAPARSRSLWPASRCSPSSPSCGSPGSARPRRSWRRCAGEPGRATRARPARPHPPWGDHRADPRRSGARARGLRWSVDAAGCGGRIDARIDLGRSERRRPARARVRGPC